MSHMRNEIDHGKRTLESFESPAVFTRYMECQKSLSVRPPKYDSKVWHVSLSLTSPCWIRDGIVAVEPFVLSHRERPLLPT